MFAYIIKKLVHRTADLWKWLTKERKHKRHRSFYNLVLSLLSLQKKRRTGVEEVRTLYLNLCLIPCAWPLTKKVSNTLIAQQHLLRYSKNGQK